MEKIKLTYDESKIRKSIKVAKETDVETGDIIVTTKTIITIPCVFKSIRMDKMMSEFGFTSFPEGMRNILKNHGFSYDYNANGWVAYVTGVAKHVARVKEDGTTEEEDKYSEEWGYNVALTRAKVISQKKAYDVMCEFAGLFDTVSEIFHNSLEHFTEVHLAEVDALSRAMLSGYCDINKN